MLFYDPPAKSCGDFPAGVAPLPSVRANGIAASSAFVSCLNSAGVRRTVQRNTVGQPSRSVASFGGQEGRMRHRNFPQNSRKPSPVDWTVHDRTPPPPGTGSCWGSESPSRLCTRLPTGAPADATPRLCSEGVCRSRPHWPATARSQSGGAAGPPGHEVAGGAHCPPHRRGPGSGTVRRAEPQLPQSPCAPLQNGQETDRNAYSSRGATTAVMCTSEHYPPSPGTHSNEHIARRSPPPPPGSKPRPPLPSHLNKNFLWRLRRHCTVCSSGSGCE